MTGQCIIAVLSATRIHHSRARVCDRTLHQKLTNTQSMATCQISVASAETEDVFMQHIITMIPPGSGNHFYLDPKMSILVWTVVYFSFSPYICNLVSVDAYGFDSIWVIGSYFLLTVLSSAYEFWSFDLAYFYI